MRLIVSSMLMAQGLLMILTSGLFTLGRRGESGAYWLTYHSAAPVVIHRRWPDGRIFNIELDSAQAVQLWDWSPDGRWLLFSMESAQGRDLFRVHGSGMPVQQLTDLPDDAFDAAYSPDGEWILFSTGAFGAAALYRIPARGGAVQRLTEDAIRPSAVAWSPNGEWIAFSAPDNEFRWSIYRMRPDGSDRERLYESPNFHDSGGHPVPTWSADGGWIVFSDGQPAFETQLYRMHPDGSALQALTEGDAEHFLPIFADGGLYFSSNQSGVYEVFRLNPDAAPVCDSSDLCHTPLLAEPITTRLDDNFALSPSPDGDWLLSMRVGYSSAGDLDRDFHLVRADGSRSQFVRTLISPQPGTNAWSPLIDMPFRSGNFLALGILLVTAGLLRRRRKDAHSD